MIINFSNIGSGSGGGGSYTLPVATANRLGGVKVGSGLTIDQSGVLSASGGTAAEAFSIVLSTMEPNDFTQEDLAAMQSMVDYLSGFTLNTLPSVRIVYGSCYYTLLSAWENGDGEGAVWNEYEFSYAGASGDYGEDAIPFIADFILNGNDVSESYERFWEPSESGNGPRIILLNNLSQSELVDLFDEITSMYDYEEMAFTSEFNASNYAFYLDLTDSDKQSAIGVGDRNYEGWFPMVLSYVNPSDYDGGAIYFTGVEGRQDGNANLYNIRFIVTNQGYTEAGTWSVEPPQPDYQHYITVESGGTFSNPDDLGIFSSENLNYKVMFVWRKGNDQPDWGQAPLKYVYRAIDQNDDLVYHWAADNISIDGVKYRGVWHATENDWWNYTIDLWEEVPEDEGVWIAVMNGGYYDSANSIYTLEEFVGAALNHNFDKFPIRFYYSGITGYPVEGYELGTIDAITLNPNANDGLNIAFSAHVPVADDVYSLKVFLERGLGGTYIWSNIGWTLEYSIGNPN